MNHHAGGLLLLIALISGCSSTQSYDYSAFRQSRPGSILVLPPLNHSPDINAGYSLLSQVTMPLAESGYYVMPVALVDQTFRQNGLANPGEIHAVALEKLLQIFGADAVLYLTVTKYGTSYQVLLSDTRVSVDARLLDLRTGQLLWEGSATASSTEQQTDSSGGIVGMLMQAIVYQIADTITEKSHQIAGLASQRLLSAGRPNGMLYGPRSPHYNSE